MKRHLVGQVVPVLVELRRLLAEVQWICWLFWLNKCGVLMHKIGCSSSGAGAGAALAAVGGTLGLFCFS
jgi:hypothetical protein